MNLKKVYPSYMLILPLAIFFSILCTAIYSGLPVCVYRLEPIYH